MSKILITGGAGFVGFHLATAHSDKNDEVTIADNFFRGKKDAEFEALLARENVTMIEVDLTIRDNWNKLGGGYDYIYHLISINGFRHFKEIPHEVLRVGLTTTLHVLDWLRTNNNNPGAKIIYTSSNEVYTGSTESFGPPIIPTPENVPLVISDPHNPRWSYAGQKLIGELLFIHYSKAYNFRMSIVRPHNIYGPRGGFDSMIPKIIDRIQKHTEPFPLVSPNENRSSCYISDVIDAMILTMESSNTDGETYNIGGNSETTVGKIAETMFTILGWKPTKFDIKENPNDSNLHCLPDVSRIKIDTGWEPKISLGEGLKKTAEWYLKTTPRS